MDEHIIDLNSYFRLYYDVKSLKKLFINTKIEKHFSYASLLFLCYDREVNLNTIKFKNEFDDEVEERINNLINVIELDLLNQK